MKKALSTSDPKACLLEAFLDNRKEVRVEVRRKLATEDLVGGTCHSMGNEEDDARSGFEAGFRICRFLDRGTLEEIDLSAEEEKKSLAEWVERRARESGSEGVARKAARVIEGLGGRQVIEPPRAARPTPVHLPPDGPALTQEFTTFCRGRGQPDQVHRNASRWADAQASEKEAVELAIAGEATEEVLCEKFGILMTRAKFKCLRPATWLNDEVINFYGAMLGRRDRDLCAIEGAGRKPSHFFNSFFMEKLLVTDKGYKFDNVRRWTKSLDILLMDNVYFPINQGNSHWLLAVIDVTRKQIRLYNSTNKPEEEYLRALWRWLQEEVATKKQAAEREGGGESESTFKPEEWVCSQVFSCPQQQNGTDCGVFVVMAMDHMGDGLALNYHQARVNSFRIKMGADILRGSLTYPLYRGDGPTPAMHVDLPARPPREERGLSPAEFCALMDGSETATPSEARAKRSWQLVMEPDKGMAILDASTRGEGRSHVYPSLLEDATAMLYLLLDGGHYHFARPVRTERDDREVQTVDDFTRISEAVGAAAEGLIAAYQVAERRGAGGIGTQQAPRGAGTPIPTISSKEVATAPALRRAVVPVTPAEAFRAAAKIKLNVVRRWVSGYARSRGHRELGEVSKLGEV